MPSCVSIALSVVLNIRSYTSGTPNGQKINIALEELSLNYTVHNVEISKNVQKEEWFLKINRMCIERIESSNVVY